MSGGKETPRQKMIGMMYLVLTALLALNVSKEILNAFVIIEDGLNVTNTNFDSKNGILYSKFEKAMGDNKTKTKPWFDKAQTAKKLSADLCGFIDEIKSELYQKIQQIPKEVAPGQGRHRDQRHHASPRGGPGRDPCPARRPHRPDRRRGHRPARRPVPRGVPPVADPARHPRDGRARPVHGRRGGRALHGAARSGRACDHPAGHR